VLLKEAGFLDVSAEGRLTAYRACITPAGGLAGVVLARADDERTARQVTELFTSKTSDPSSGIAKVHTGEEVHALGGFPDAFLVLEAAPDAYFAGGLAGPLVSGSPNRGTHGFPPDRPEMLASCLLSGRGVRPGLRTGIVSLRDIAPTVSELLGISMPTAKGRVLRELLI
jgi:hypothetical protein